MVLSAIDFTWLCKYATMWHEHELQSMYMSKRINDSSSVTASTVQTTQTTTTKKHISFELVEQIEMLHDSNVSQKAK